MTTDPNAPTFSTETDKDYPSLAGLTKREYFAAMAMQGLLANPQLTIKHDHECRMGEGDCPFDALTLTARIYADYLIQELNDNA